MTADLMIDPKSKVVDYLKRLLDAVESDKVAVRGIDTPCVQEQHRLGLVEYLWKPEIQFLIISPETRELFQSLRFDHPFDGRSS